MNHRGVDMYARNRGTRQYGGKTAAVHADPIKAACPVCLANVTYHENRFAQHVEFCGFTICPSSGHSRDLAKAMAATMTDDFRLAAESALETITDGPT